MIKAFIQLFGSIVASLAGWILVAPLTVLVPKRRDWIAVVGRQNGRFLDNAKYFFLMAASTRSDLRVTFISEKPEVVETITKQGFRALRYPGLASCWHLARCGSAVADSTDWIRHMRRFLLIRARIVQLWHGIPLKRIELDYWRNVTGRYAWTSRRWAFRMRMLAYRFMGRWIRFAVVATPSTYYREHAFRRAFAAREFPVSGYPRNDFAQSLRGSARELAWSNTDPSVRAKLDEWQRLGRKLVLVTPTFRDSGAVPMQLDAATLPAIDAFAEAHGVELIFKFHPSERNADHIGGAHFHVCARDSDIYPLFPFAAALVTDYSSIGTDFLLTDKPLLYLVPEGDDYSRKDREFLFDPRSMMPGRVVHDWLGLTEALVEEWAHDAFATERARLRALAFDDLPQAAATGTLLRCMEHQGWIKATHDDG